MILDKAKSIYEKIPRYLVVLQMSKQRSNDCFIHEIISFILLVKGSTTSSVSILFLEIFA